MDYSQFVFEDFQAKDWINNLIAQNSVDTLEKDLTDIVIKLQFYMEEMNAIVDESTQTAFQSLPRIIREMESVRQEASVLQEQMRLTKSDIEKIEKSTQDSMRKLLKIDAKKEKLSQLENALQEADSWTQICNNIDNIIKSRDINKIADKIASLQHSLSMLASTPDYEEREKKVQFLCDHFESVLGPQLIQSFFNKDFEFIRLGMNLLNKINRVEYGSKYYQAWFKPSVEEIWNQFKSNEEVPEENMLKRFFENLLSFCNQELDKQIFPNTGTVLIVALTESLIHLEEQFSMFIKKPYTNTSDVKTRITFVTCCIQVTDLFCEQLEISIQAKCADLHLIDSHVCNRLANILYKQYIGIDEIFTKESELYIQKKLNEIKMDSMDVTESIDVLNSSINSVMDLARELVRYCETMTHFTSIGALVECIKNLFTNYITEFKRVCLNIILKLSSQQAVSIDHTDNVDSGMDDYYFLQDGIRLTSLGGHISVKSELFLQEMLNQIIHHVQKLNAAQSTSIFFRKYPVLLTESHTKQDEIIDLWKQISNIDSQITLLKFPHFKSVEDTRQYIKFKLLRWLNKKVFINAIEPVKKSLLNVHKSDIWAEELETGEALPQFAFSPQEYITKIGQFFMTLPQQLEPFFSTNSAYYQESLLAGQLPYMSEAFYTNCLEPDQKDTKSDNKKSSNTLHVAHVWLESIVSGCLVQLLNQWMNIPKLSVNGKHQLQADMNYIQGVVEDLDLQMSSDINLFAKLINASNIDDITEMASIYNISSKMVDVVKKILF